MTNANRTGLSASKAIGSLKGAESNDLSSEMPQRPRFIGMIWAQNQQRIIGDGNDMPWHVPEDLKHFKTTTVGAPVVMGRKTWESLNPRFRPLPERRNIVLSHSASSVASDCSVFAGAELASSLEEAFALTATEPRVWIMGGGQLYRHALGVADECVVTEIDMPVNVESPVYAPSLDGWKMTNQGDWQNSTSGLRFRFTTYRRAD